MRHTSSHKDPVICTLDKMGTPERHGSSSSCLTTLGMITPRRRGPTSHRQTQPLRDIVPMLSYKIMLDIAEAVTSARGRGLEVAQTGRCVRVCTRINQIPNPKSSTGISLKRCGTPAL